MSEYCAVAKAILSSSPPPYAGFICDVFETAEYPGVVFLRVYADNLASFSDTKVAGIAQWLNKVLKLLNEHPLVNAQYRHMVTEKNPHV